MDFSKTHTADSLLVMPPPEGEEWLAEYCAVWRNLVDAQKELLAAQARLSAAQERLLVGLETSVNRKRSKAVNKVVRHRGEA